MRKFFGMLVALPVLAGTVLPSLASCLGSGSFQTCNDNSGNSYSVQRFGNQTNMSGYNAQTGSTWSQHSATMGNTTFHNGVTNGNSWNMTDQRFGNARTYSGTDSRGQSFFYSCNQFGCN
jgi:hypothetical protein